MNDSGGMTRYAEIARFVLKYRKAPIFAAASVDDAISRAEPQALAQSNEAEQFVADLEKLGPTFVKIGQSLSTRPDLVPPEYIAALERMQDDVGQVEFADIRDVVEQELGVRITKAFETFDERPLAAASLAQVHRATLRGGRPVAVKVQRPGVAEQVAADLDVLNQIADYLSTHTEAGQRYDLSGMVEEFRTAINAELDYVQEAEHLQTIGRNLAELQMVIVPQPIAGYTTTRVLTMDYISGTKVTAIIVAPTMAKVFVKASG